MIPLFFIVAFLTAATSTSLELHHLVVAARRSLLDIIQARQLNTGECASLCSSVATTVTSCTTSDCLCTTAIAVSIQDCVNCAVGDDPSIGEVSSAQSIIDTFESLCSTVTGIPSVTINTNPATTSQSTPTATIPLTTSVIGSQIVIGPSSTTSAPITQAAASVGSTSTASIVGSPLKASASTNEIIFFHWTGALLALAVGNLLVI